jgi:acetyl-CoA C-acetyltransferase
MRGRDAWIFEAVRTPRGVLRKGAGALAGVKPVRLVGVLLDELKARGIDPARVDDVLLGASTQVGDQGANVAKAALLCASWPEAIPASMVNRLCISGLEAVAIAAAKVGSGHCELVIAGGVESMSRVPMWSDEGAWFADPEVAKSSRFVHMGVAADLIATLDGWTREELDAVAVESHARAASASASAGAASASISAGAAGAPSVGASASASAGAAGALSASAGAATAGSAASAAAATLVARNARTASSIVPVRDADGKVILSTDDGIREGTSLAKLAALPAAFADFGATAALVVRKRYPEVDAVKHLHTVATSPQTSDGASLVVVATLEAGRAMGLEPRARITSYAATSSDPVAMLTGPSIATRHALDRAGRRISDVAVFEHNESFAATCLRFQRDLDVDPSRINPRGGAIALGHPLGATGGMLVGALVDELIQRNETVGVVAMCAGAGLAAAMVLERS